MPLYEYECDACGERFEVIQKFSDPVPDACAKCGKGPVRRLLSSPAIQFKGSGWYITDYAQKGKSDSGGSSKGKSSSSESTKTESSSDSGTKDSSTKSDASTTSSSSTSTTSTAKKD
jgi:putative FmdB family regulatory protein